MARPTLPQQAGTLGWWRPATALARIHRGLVASLIVLTLGAWAYSVHHAISMDMSMGVVARGAAVADGTSGMAMSGVAAAGWSATGAAVFVVAWTVMMAAMMLPAAAPMIAIFASAQARRQARVAVPTWIFVAGYVLVWAAAGLLVYAVVQTGSDIAGALGAAQRAQWAPLALSATLIAAGVYQFTPAKRVCLRHCRSPFGFVMQHWRDGRLGALRMGLHHGAYCLGCCWALFGVLVAAGVMSMAWMLLLTVVVFVEKVLPHPAYTSAVVGIALTALGMLVLAGTVPMPWTA